MRLPAPGLIVLIGPPASGKTTWASTHLRPDVVVSSDRLRGAAQAAHGRREVDAAVEALNPKRATPESYAAAVSAGTIADHVGRFRALACRPRS